MTDLYTKLVNNPAGKFIAGNVGLPRPIPLDRHSPGDPVIRGRVLVGAAPGGRLNDAIARVLEQSGADARHQHDESESYKALVFDATGIRTTEELVELHRFFSPSIRRVKTSGRVIVLGTPMEACADPREATAQRALEGFARSVGKEVRKGATAQLVKVHPGAEGAIDSTLRFLLSPKSAYVSGQVIEISPSGSAPSIDWERPLEGRVALVTGSSRGIGAAIAATLARDGAHVVGVDVPPLEDDLRAVADELGGSALTLDITEASAPKAIVAHLRKEHGGVDVVVHNAGITRDKTLGRMDEERWTKLMEVNVSAPERITEALLAGKGVLRADGRIVGVSSISGIAGNAGQTNYATSKAAVIGFVRSWAPRVAEAGGTINAVAPGFIETAMTAAMPIGTREAGRRLNSLSQGGLPVDVAETIAWFANPASGGVNGNVVRVCGQSLIGA